MNTKSLLLKSVAFFLFFTLLCGVIYPLTVTGISQVIFPDKANGSMIQVDGKVYGSALLGQQYTDDTHMWGRIMNMDTGTYVDQEGNAVAYATPSNLSPASEEYGALIAERAEKIRAAHPERKDIPIPVDLVTCSGSGLDPHISKDAAEYQIERLARTTGKSVKEIQAIIDRYTEKPFLGFIGQETVNVLEVNLALDGILE